MYLGNFLVLGTEIGIQETKALLSFQTAVKLLTVSLVAVYRLEMEDINLLNEP